MFPLYRTQSNNIHGQGTDGMAGRHLLTSLEERLMVISDPVDIKC